MAINCLHTRVYISFSVSDNDAKLGDFVVGARAECPCSVRALSLTYFLDLRTLWIPDSFMLSIYGTSSGTALHESIIAWKFSWLDRYSQSVRG